MGAWGRGPFENDFAADWVYELEAASDWSVVQSALTSVVTTSGYLDAMYGSTALAAAEVVAAALGHPAPGLPETVTAWVAAHGSNPSADDVTLARRAVVRVNANDSELRDLWREAADKSFEDGTEDLRRRLTSPQ
jgi:hypothetical protein